jgi:hypothetical protein
MAQTLRLSIHNRERLQLVQGGFEELLSAVNHRRPGSRCSLGRFMLKTLMRLNLGLGLWLTISPFVLEFVTRRAFQVGWEDFLLGFGITTFSLCRLSSRGGAELWDFVIMALGLTTLVNPIVYHYFNVKVIAWNNVLIGSLVLILTIYELRKNGESPQTSKQNRDY